MQNVKNAALSISIGSLIFLIHPMATSVPAFAETYFECGPRFTRVIDKKLYRGVMQTKKGAVRCYLPSVWQFRRPENCGPAQSYRIDYTGNKDKCVAGVGGAAVVLDPGCPPNFKLKRRSKKDRCGRFLKPVIKPPSHKVWK